MEKPTFGVELEFLTFRPQNKLPAEEYITTYLLAPVTLPCNKPGCNQGAHEWRLPIRESGPSYRTNNYTSWNITNDASVSSDRETELIIVGKSVEKSIEIQSRIMNFEGTTPCPDGQFYPCTGESFEWQWRDEITAVVDAIARAYSRPGYRACVNESAGMHVHLGNGKSPMPVEVVKGVTGTFTALERHIDRILPTSRIYGYEGDFCLPGVDTTNQVGNFEESGVGCWSYCKGMASVMLKHSEISLIRELEKSPGEQSEARIEKAVKSINVPAWLELIKQQATKEAMQGLWMNSDHIRADPHESAVNLENLGRGKGTVEIRLHQASLDAEEIMAWVDLMGKIALWTASASDVFAYLLTAWAVPDSDIVDFAGHVGADTSTLSHYIAKTRPGFAKERYNRLVAAPKNPADELHALTRAIEFNRYNDFRPDSVLDKIWWKITSGRYGQFTTTCLNAAVPNYIRNTKLGSYLCLNTCDWQSWIDYSTSEYRERFIDMIEARKITRAHAEIEFESETDSETETNSSESNRSAGSFVPDALKPTESEDVELGDYVTADSNDRTKNKNKNKITSDGFEDVEF